MRSFGNCSYSDPGSQTRRGSRFDCPRPGQSNWHQCLSTTRQHARRLTLAGFCMFQMKNVPSCRKGSLGAAFPMHARTDRLGANTNVPSYWPFLFPGRNLTSAKELSQKAGASTEFSAVVIKRNRSRPSVSLEARLLRFAEEARAAANFIAPGPQQDQLLSKAIRAETLARAADRLSLAEDLAIG